MTTTKAQQPCTPRREAEILISSFLPVNTCKMKGISAQVSLMRNEKELEASGSNTPRCHNFWHSSHTRLQAIFTQEKF